MRNLSSRGISFILTTRKYKKIILFFTLFILFITCRLSAQTIQNIGINTLSPQATLDVGGEIKIGDAANPPQAGMVRWNPASNDFEGYNGSKWISLTKSNTPAGQWGQIASANVNETIKLTASDGASSDKFGQSVSISGDYAIVGAYWDDVGSNIDQGSAYIFVRSGTTWIQQAKLTASDGALLDFFGSSVGISGDYAIVGAYADNIGVNSDQGCAYIFVRSGTTWTQQAKLTASDGLANDNFGWSVGIDGDYAIVGAFSQDISAVADRGSAYIFVRSGTTWTQQTKLTASDGDANDQFGNSVSISGNYAVVGAYTNDIGTASNQGAAYVFFRSGTTWTQQAQLLASDGLADDLFGIKVSISGDYLIVGAYGDDFSALINRGSAYIFVRSGSTWSQQAKLTSADGNDSDFFGSSVGISGNYAVVGAFNVENGSVSSQGAAYIYMRNGTTWTQQAKVTASDGTENDNFGYSAAISGSNVIIGANSDDIDVAADQGSVYILQRN